MRLCDNASMRTTIELSADAYHVAKAFATQHRVSLGRAISQLILSPAQSSTSLVKEGRFLTYRGKQVLTPELAKELDNEY